MNTDQSADIKAGETLQGLITSEARFRDFAELAADWFFELDANLHFSYYSTAVHFPSGMKLSELIGKSEIEVYQQWVDKSDLVSAYLVKLNAHEAIDMEIELVDAAGARIFLHIIARPLVDDGRFRGYRGCSRDVTEVRLSALTVQQSENRFRKIIDNVPDIITTVNENGVYDYYNKSIERMLGYTPEEVRKLSVGDVAIAQDRQVIIDAHREAMENPGKVVKASYRCKHKNGEIRVLESTRQLLLPTEDALRELVIHSRDITEQYKAQQNLLESEQRLRDFAETAADWFWEQDENLRFTGFSGSIPVYLPQGIDVFIGKTREECVTGVNFDSHEWREFCALLQARLPFSNFEHQISSFAGKPNMVRISGKPIFDDQGSFRGYRGSSIDITESHRLSQQLSYQATHDPLTGLINRREFELRLARVIADSHRERNDNALCYIDLDQFKVVNDTCGHDAGDELLRQISSVLQEKVRKGDTIARLGGDEFGLLMERCSLKQADRVAETVRKTIADFRFIWASRSFHLGVSIGVIPINSQSGNINEVMRAADAACYVAKDAGRNRVHIYNPGNADVLERHAAMQRFVDINSAFDDERFTLYRQSILDLNPQRAGSTQSCEILVRMLDKQGNLVLPGAFMPTAERYNLVTQLDTWVVKNSLAWLATTADLRCAINISGMSMADEVFLLSILQLLDTSNIDAGRICFEITETAAIANLQMATNFINQLRDRGCLFALDDFGSGLSSFAYLKTLPVDFLKIDGFFVRDIVDDPISLEMVKSINDIGHVMGKQTIAEFVENDQILAEVKRIGVDFAQGYGISRPEPV